MEIWSLIAKAGGKVTSHLLFLMLDNTACIILWTSFAGESKNINTYHMSLLISECNTADASAEQLGKAGIRLLNISIVEA